MEDKRSFGQKMDEFLLKDSTFILLIMGAAAAIFAGTFMYLKFGTGAFNDISIVAMLKEGIDTGDYAAAAAFAAGFLIARILEGPLVGLLDIGGSLQTGAVIGLVLGAVIMIIRKLMPEGVAVGGTSVMMGAGNATGRYLAPLIVLAAASYNVYAGLGAVIGAAAFYKWGKEMTGGAILGAMIIGGIFI